MRLKHWSVIPAPPPRPTLIPAGDLQHTLWEDALTALKQLLQLWRNDAQDSVNTKAAPTFSQLERRPRHLWWQGALALLASWNSGRCLFGVTVGD